MTAPTHERVKGSALKVGDALSVWWSPKTDIITELVPYEGALKHLFPEGAQLASFAILKTGMTIDNSDYYEIVRTNNDNK